LFFFFLSLFLFPSPSCSHITGDLEAQLDIQMQTGMGQGAAQGFYIENGWMYDFAVSVFTAGSAPRGWCR